MKGTMVSLVLDWSVVVLLSAAAALRRLPAVALRAGSPARPPGLRTAGTPRLGREKTETDTP